jgi:hypothetical protein
MFGTRTPLNRKLEAKFLVALFVFRYEDLLMARRRFKKS